MRFKKGHTNLCKGKTWEKFYGIEKAKIMKINLSRIRRQKIKEGKIKVWNTGLTKETDERVRKMSNSKRESKFVNCSNCNKEIYRSPYNIGKFKNHFCDRECYGKWLTERPNPKGSKTKKRLYKEGKLINPKGMLGKKHSKKTKKKMSVKFKENWQNPEFREKTIKINRKKMEKINKDPKVIKKRLKSLIKKPNKVELKLNQILQDNFPNEFKYVGDGEVIIDRLNPDFINCNGKKLIIEMFGNYWHSKERRHMTEEQRIKRFAKYGFKTLIIWENELKNEKEIVGKVAKAIEKFE